MLKLMFDIDSNPEFEVLESLNESTGEKTKKYVIRGVFSTMGERNRNGRIYPKNLWESEISKYQENFQSGSINTLMEWEHPARTTVDPMEAVAKITSLGIKDNFVMGEAVLLNNPKANQIKSLIDNGVKISVSSRALGSVRDGIVNNFRLVTYDLVATPADYNATMNGLVESYQLNEGVIDSLDFGFDETNNIVSLDKFSRETLESAILEKFKNILKKF